MRTVQQVLFDRMKSLASILHNLAEEEKDKGLWYQGMGAGLETGSNQILRILEEITEEYNLKETEHANKTTI